MDIILKPIVTFIQSLDGMSNAILAGGAVRDKMFGLEPRDYDIFVPAKDKNALRDALTLIRKEFTTTEVTNKSQDYGVRLGTSSRIEGTKLTEVLNFKYKDRDIDIIGVNVDDDEEFATKTIEGFDYGINMVYDTGRYIDDGHSKFRRDFDNHYMTLHRIGSLDHLPKAMKRFESFNTRIKEAHGYQFYFDSPVLRIESVKDKRDKYTTKSKYYPEDAPEPATIDWGTPAPAVGATPWATVAATQAINTINQQMNNLVGEVNTFGNTVQITNNQT